MSGVSLSVIIPFFNAGSYLGRCLDSVVNQDIQGFEIICINDGSTDNSLSVAEEYAGRYPSVKVISQENRGLSNARNRGMEAAEGEYIMFADGDDYLEKNVLGRLYAVCREYQLDMLDFRVNIVTGDGIVSMYPGMRKTTGAIAGIKYFSEFISMYGKQPFVSAWSHLYRREFLSENNLHFIDGRKYEDLVFTATAYIRATSPTPVPPGTSVSMTVTTRLFRE